MSKSIYCPFCHKYVELSIRTSFENSWLGQCNSCQRIVLVDNVRNVIYPNPIPKPVDSRIVSQIKKDMEESYVCFSDGCYRAAAVMARRALQSTCLDKGADEKDDLYHQIDWIFKEGIITKDIKDWAHEVRLVGNDAAHPKKPSEDQPVTKEDAEDILNLLEQFCQVLYVTPAIAQERQKARQKK